MLIFEMLHTPYALGSRILPSCLITRKKKISGVPSTSLLFHDLYLQQFMFGFYLWQKFECFMWSDCVAVGTRWASVPIRRLPGKLSSALAIFEVSFTSGSFSPMSSSPGFYFFRVHLFSPTLDHNIVKEMKTRGIMTKLHDDIVITRGSQLHRNVVMTFLSSVIETCNCGELQSWRHRLWPTSLVPDFDVTRTPNIAVPLAKRKQTNGKQGQNIKQMWKGRNRGKNTVFNDFGARKKNTDTSKTAQARQELLETKLLF